MYVELFFEQYQDGRDFSEIVSVVIDIFENHKGDINPDAVYEYIKNYDIVKERFMLQLINTENNRDFLETVPHCDMLDLSAIVRVVIDADYSGSATAIVTNEHLEAWEVTEEQLIEDALTYSSVNHPASFKSLVDVITELMGLGPEFPNIFGPESVNEADNGMRVLSNTEGMYGAAVIMYCGLLKEISKLVGGDFYLLPSSIHEVIILTGDSVEPDALTSMVQDVNNTEVRPEEVLSDHCYFYDSENDILLIPEK